MCQVDIKNGDTRIDPCIREMIKNINALKNGLSDYEIVACCCGHRKYPMTIIIKAEKDYPKRKEDLIFDLVSGVEIPRKRKFYKRDKKGVYYIPEVIKK